MAKILGGIIVVVIVIGAFFMWQGKKATVPVVEEPKVMLPALEEKGNNMVTSIKDAMGLGKAMQCIYMTNEGDATLARSSTVMIDGQKFKSVTQMKDKTVYALFDGEDQYTWMSDSKEGMKMSKSCLEKTKDMVKNLPQSSTAPSPESQDVRSGFDMAQDVSCTPASAPDLSVPADITFTDQCAMMEQSMKMMEQMKTKMPAGTTPMSTSNSAEPY